MRGNQLVFGLVFILITIMSTISGQLMVKKGMLQNKLSGIHNIFETLINGLINPWVIAGLFMAVIGAFAWILTLSRLPLSFAYPFLSITFPVVVIASSMIFKENVSWNTYIGLTFIIVGIIIASRAN